MEALAKRMMWFSRYGRIGLSEQAFLPLSFMHALAKGLAQLIDEEKPEQVTNLTE